MGGDTGIELDLTVVVAEVLDILFEADLALIDVDMLAVLDLGGDILGGNTAEELAVLTRLRLDDELGAFELLLRLLRVSDRGITAGVFIKKPPNVEAASVLHVLPVPHVLPSASPSALPSAPAAFSMSEQTRA